MAYNFLRVGCGHPLWLSHNLAASPGHLPSPSSTSASSFLERRLDNISAAWIPFHDWKLLNNEQPYCRVRESICCDGILWSWGLNWGAQKITKREKQRKQQVAPTVKKHHELPWIRLWLWEPNSASTTEAHSIFPSSCNCPSGGLYHGSVLSTLG